MLAINQFITEGILPKNPTARKAVIGGAALAGAYGAYKIWDKNSGGNNAQAATMATNPSVGNNTQQPVSQNASSTPTGAMSASMAVNPTASKNPTPTPTAVKPATTPPPSTPPQRDFVRASNSNPAPQPVQSNVKAFASHHPQTYNNVQHTAMVDPRTGQVIFSSPVNPYGGVPPIIHNSSMIRPYYGHMHMPPPPLQTGLIHHNLVAQNLQTPNILNFGRISTPPFVPRGGWGWEPHPTMFPPPGSGLSAYY